MSREVHSKAWLDHGVDVIHIKVTLYTLDEATGSVVEKKGIRFKLTEEQFMSLQPGSAYPERRFVDVLGEPMEIEVFKEE